MCESHNILVGGCEVEFNHFGEVSLLGQVALRSLSESKEQALQYSAEQELDGPSNVSYAEEQ